MLNSDELGEKGQSRFQELCADAKLTCNPSTRDRTGSDFIVEFPFTPPSGNDTLDTRSTPIACHVQVKTMWERNDSFQMRLSSAERLAKELKPAFVYVLKVSERLEFVDAYIIHVFDDVLALILKKLRIEAFNKNLSINKKKISIKPSATGERLEPNGQELREFLTRLCGDDMHQYATRKSQQLKSLGYDSTRLEATMKFIVSDEEEIVDAFLGLKEIEIEEFQTFETRFGIKLPNPEPNFPESKLRIEPGGGEKCTITFRRLKISPPVIFEGIFSMPVLPGLSPDQLKFLVKTDFFTLLIRKGSFKFTNDLENIKSLAFTVEEWMSYFRLVETLEEGQGTIAIVGSHGQEVNLPINNKIKAEPNGAAKNHLSIFEKLSNIVRHDSAVSPNTKFLIHEVLAQSENIVLLQNLLNGDFSTYTVQFVSRALVEDFVEEEATFLLIDYLRFKGICIAYYAISRFKPTQKSDGVLWHIISAELQEIKAIRSDTQTYTEYINAAKELTGSENLIARPWDDIGGEPAK